MVPQRCLCADSGAWRLPGRRKHHTANPTHTSWNSRIDCNLNGVNAKEHDGRIAASKHATDTLDCSRDAERRICSTRHASGTFAFFLPMAADVVDSLDNCRQSSLASFQRCRWEMRAGDAISCASQLAKDNKVSVRALERDQQLHFNDHHSWTCLHVTDATLAQGKNDPAVGTQPHARNGTKQLRVCS